MLGEIAPRTIPNPKLGVEKSLNLTTDAIKAKAISQQYKRRKNVRRYRIKSPKYVPTTTTTQAMSTEHSTVTRVIPPTIVTTTPRPKSRVDFFIDTAKLMPNRVMAESKVALSKPTGSQNLTQQKVGRFEINQTVYQTTNKPRAFSDASQSTVWPTLVSKLWSTTRSPRAHEIHSTNPIRTLSSDTKSKTLRKTNPFLPENVKSNQHSVNLTMSKLFLDVSDNQRETKRRDLTRPVYIPGQTYHPDELQKITFNDPKTKQQYYFCKNHGSTLWRIPKEEPLCHELHRLLKPWSKGSITLFSIRIY